MANKPTRILAWDLSLACPGAAVVEVRNKKAKVIAVSHVKTSDKHSYAVRGRLIESWARLFIESNQTKAKPYDVILREKYAGKFGHHSIYTSHIAADRALFDFGLEDTEKPIAQQSVKKTVVGKGRAEKDEVEVAVRKITGYKGEFATSDESDSVAIALAYAIQKGLISKGGD